MVNRRGVSLLLLSVMVVAHAETTLPVQDSPFIQEFHEPYPIAADGPANDVRSIAVDKADTVYAATKTGVFALRDGSWSQVSGVTTGPTYELTVDGAGVVWVAAWDGVYRNGTDDASKEVGVDGSVSVVATTPEGMIALGPDGAWRKENGAWRAIKDAWSRNIRDAVTGPRGELWIATGAGLYRVDGKGVRHYSKTDEIYSGDINALAVAPDGRLWVGAWGGIDVFENDVRVAHIEGKHGLPNYIVTSLAFAPDGVLWAGTKLGVARFLGSADDLAQIAGTPIETSTRSGETEASADPNRSRWSLRHSRRWLLSDEVRSVAFDSHGTAWVATTRGVSAIKRRTMTLADKAAHYLDICMKRHVRPPGLVEKCYFPNPNDPTVWEPKDDDNDGSYTAVFMAAECLRYAVTKDPQAKANADAAYDAMEFLQTVTRTDGFFARTVIPSDWPNMADANETISAEEMVERRVRDPRYKPVEVRWRTSTDGKWLWKGDTSSDELTGHMFGYYFYYTFAADDAHKERVKKLVHRIMSHVLDNGLTLTDIDGTPTRWAVWSPEKINGDPDWRVEAPINAFEMLSFLKVAYRITGDDKFEKAYRKLINEHGYAELARRPKSFGRSEWTYIDDELMCLATPGLMAGEDDLDLRAIYLEGLTWSYRTIENDDNPYYNFTFGSIGIKNCHVEDSVAFLRDQPLDLRHYAVDNAKREDIKLVRRPMQEPLQTSRMLPPSERGVMRWDKSPWDVISGDFGDEEGHRESSGAFWMLPYWMGRYYGFISGPMEQAR